MKVVAIIQARMGSSRLPGKILMDLAGQPMLARVIRRAQRAQNVSEAVIATSGEEREQPIVDLCRQNGWTCFRGSENDVLDRYYQAAKEHDAEVVVRVTSDCPCTEPAIIDAVIRKYVDDLGRWDYVCNFWPRRTFPRGLDVEVFGFEVLQKVWRECKSPAWREHVTPSIYRQPGVFRIGTVWSKLDLSHLRWTVDTAADLELIRKVFEIFQHDRFTWMEVVRLLRQHSDWSAMTPSPYPLPLEGERVG